MADSALTKKLGLKPGRRALILNAPDGYRALLDPLPQGVDLTTTPDGTFDFVQLFAKNKADLAEYAPAAMAAVNPGGMLWISFPKKTSKIQTDISRDTGWDVIQQAGWQGVFL
ncbi:MAG TPA: hypothetical protein VF276_18780, partial [Chloroflexia bacterium]